MPTPYFYIPSFNSSEDTIQLDEETSKHLSGVLRMKKGELVQITDGKGQLAMAEIVDDHRKKCVVRIQSITPQQKSETRNVTIAISLLKNSELPTPYFYIPSFNSSEDTIQLDEETSKHLSGVLRMKKGELVQVTDGKGQLAMAEIVDDHRKKCVVRIQSITPQQKSETRNVTIAISLLKNSSRFEWFLEKATEIGISEIIPLLCERTEKEKFRIDRMQNILVSAMLQSQQRFLPILHEPVSFHSVISSATQNKKFIAHCIEDEKKHLVDVTNVSMYPVIILIGPPGDFTPGEVQLAIQHHFDPVSLGRTRLRTETAGIVAAAFLSG